MNVLIINGSPRKTGSTAAIANVFGEAASANDANVRIYNLNDMRNIRGCQSCTKCWEASRCVVKDDFAPALADHNWADIIVWATPVYMDDMSGILKLFADRMFSYVKREFYIDHNPVHGRLVPGKQFVLIQTQAAPADMYEALFARFATIMRSCGVKDSHWLHCPGLWLQEVEGQAERLQSYEQQTRELVREICGQKVRTVTRADAAVAHQA